jgi:hypothetical protein
LLATLVVDVGNPVSYITFSGDFDALNASGMLEIKRATIYNYLISIRLPIISDTTIYKGSVASSFVADSVPENTSYAVQTVQSKSATISNLPATSIVINGRSYVVPSSDSSQTLNKGLIAGLVVGLVGGAILIAAMIVGYRAHLKRVKHRRLFNDPEMNNGSNEASTSVSNDEMNNASPLPETVNTNNATNIQVMPASGLTSINQVNSPLSSETARAASAALSITKIDVTESNQLLHPLELIQIH